MANVVQDLLYRLRADNADLVKKVKDASKKMDAFGKKMQATGKKLTLGLTVPIIGVGAAMLKLANDQQQAEAQLQNAINATGKEAEISVESLKKYASALQETTTFGDEAQLQALALVQQLSNLNEKGLKKVLPSLLDFSTAMGVDLQTAASLVGKTLGSSTNALARYGIEIDATAGPTEKLAQLTAAMDEKFKGAAETAAKTGLGALTQLKNSAGDLAEEFGAILIPELNKLIEGIREGIQWFSELDESQKKMIITIAGIAAAAGPAISAIGGISKALSFLAANPIVAVVAGVTALGVGLAALDKKRRDAGISKLEKELVSVSEKIGIAGEDLNEFARKFDDVGAAFIQGRIRGEFTTIDGLISSVAQKTGVTKVQAAELLSRQKDISKELKDQLLTLQDQLIEADKLLPLYVDYVGRAEEAARISAQRKKEREIQATKDAEEAKLAAIKTAEEKKLQFAEEFVTRNQELDTTYAEGQKAAIDELTNAHAEADELRYQHAKAKREKEKEEQEQALQELKQQALDVANALYSGFMAVGGALQGLANQAVANKQSELDNFLSANSAEIEALEAKAATDEGLTAAEQARMNELREEEKRLQKEKYKAELEAFKVNQAISIVNATVSSAEGAIAAYKALAGIPIVGPALGAIAAASVAAFGAVQVGLIASQKPPAPPQFASGVDNFIVPPGYNNDNFPINVQSGESVTVETEARQRAQGEIRITVPVYIERKQIAQVVATAFKNGEVKYQ